MPPIWASGAAGVTAEALRAFAYNIGITQIQRPHRRGRARTRHLRRFEQRALRRLAVLRPIKVIINELSEGKTEELEAVNNPERKTR